MFDAGFWEFALIFVVLLLVVGPERLPGLARKAGYWVGKGRRFVNSVRSDIEREFRTEELEKMLNQQNSEIQELKNILNDTKSDTKKAFTETESLVKAAPPPTDGMPEIPTTTSEPKPSSVLPGTYSDKDKETNAPT
ncbi:MAG TPA: twin-arginine translocase subunit TatB [Gammaproteobacteria bacterium]|nr:twin-arginine translocase subunit TatB [Gammaproteobacteria bacterium]